MDSIVTKGVEASGVFARLKKAVVPKDTVVRKETTLVLLQPRQ